MNPTNGIMSTRQQLEEEVRKAKERIDKAHKDTTPKRIIEEWIKEYDRLSFELDNLYDDRVNEFTD